MDFYLIKDFSDQFYELNRGDPECNLSFQDKEQELTDASCSANVLEELKDVSDIFDSLDPSHLKNVPESGIISSGIEEGQQINGKIVQLPDECVAKAIDEIFPDDSRGSRNSSGNNPSLLYLEENNPAHDTDKSTDRFLEQCLNDSHNIREEFNSNKLSPSPYSRCAQHGANVSFQPDNELKLNTVLSRSPADRSESIDVTIPVNIVALLSSKSKDDALDEMDGADADADVDTKKIIVPREKENCKHHACFSRGQKVTYQL